MKNKTGNTIIESIGTFLPEKAVSTKEVVEGCVNEVKFPIERITGIKERRMAGDTEYAIDLAEKAIANCFNNSKYTPEDIDLVISCNISHYDSKDRFTFEPSGSVHLHKVFGFDNATLFDISNACAGVFTGINIADAYLKAGKARRVLIVSGEYITHLTDTAQKEIQDLYDLRLACLTLGDSGVALILERSDREDIGFHHLEMFTLGDYSPYCIAKATDYPHGGAIMLTQSAQLSGVAIQEGAKHVVKTLRAYGEDDVDTMITHQTSKTSILGGIREVNKILGYKRFDTDNTVNNLEKRGNTSTTSHIVAVMDTIRSGRLKSSEKVLFSVNASGVTLGDSVYVFDDLPDRIRDFEAKGIGQTKQKPNDEMPDTSSNSKIKIAGLGIVEDEHVKKSTFSLSKYALEQCFNQAGITGDDVEMLMFTGIYRDEFICEPALAAMIAGDIKMRSDLFKEEGNSFAFDVLNGSLGFLNAIHTGISLINGGKSNNALVVTAEIENNKELWPNRLMEIEETAGAMYLTKSVEGETTGFGDFMFRAFPEYEEDSMVTNTWVDGKPFLETVPSEQLLDKYVNCAVKAVSDFMVEQRLDFDKIAAIIPQQISSEFIEKLASALNLTTDKFIDATAGKKDLFTASLPYAMNQAIKTNAVKKGDIGLIISVGSGIQVGCATYEF